mmetsp:Transcript_102278/g.327933  ORF Transcript_102278/g.327933 Transcript_102278/m.327933 type:complete len:370 (-) Transcript_102278:1423-2532(-)
MPRNIGLDARLVAEQEPRQANSLLPVQCWQHVDGRGGIACGCWSHASTPFHPRGRLRRLRGLLVLALARLRVPLPSPRRCALPLVPPAPPPAAAPDGGSGDAAHTSVQGPHDAIQRLAEARQEAPAEALRNTSDAADLVGLSGLLDDILHASESCGQVRGSNLHALLQRLYLVMLALLPLSLLHVLRVHCECRQVNYVDQVRGDVCHVLEQQVRQQQSGQRQDVGAAQCLGDEEEDGALVLRLRNRDDLLCGPAKLWYRPILEHQCTAVHAERLGKGARQHLEHEDQRRGDHRGGEARQVDGEPNSNLEARYVSLLDLDQRGRRRRLEMLCEAVLGASQHVFEGLPRLQDVAVLPHSARDGIGDLRVQS